MLAEFRIMVAEFFNSSIGDVYRIGRPTYYEAFLPTAPVGVRSDGGLFAMGGGRVNAAYVLVTCRTPVAGRILARSPHGVLELVEVQQPLRLQRSRCARPA